MRSNCPPDGDGLARGVARGRLGCRARRHLLAVRGAGSPVRGLRAHCMGLSAGFPARAREARCPVSGLQPCRLTQRALRMVPALCGGARWRAGHLLGGMLGAGGRVCGRRSAAPSEGWRFVALAGRGRGSSGGRAVPGVSYAWLNRGVAGVDPCGGGGGAHGCPYPDVWRWGLGVLGWPPGGAGAGIPRECAPVLLVGWWACPGGPTAAARVRGG